MTTKKTEQESPEKVKHTGPNKHGFKEMLAQDAKKLTLRDLAAIFAVEPKKWFQNKEIKALTQLPERLIILIN